MNLYIADHNNVLGDLKKHPDVREVPLLGADAAVVWQDFRGLNRDLVMQCNSAGIPTFVMQHGFNQGLDYEPATEFSPHQFPLFAGKAMVWGIGEKERILRAGYSEERVSVTGCAIFDHLPRRESHPGKNVVFFPAKWDTDTEENHIVLNALLRQKKFTVYTKLLDGHFNVKKYRDMHESSGGGVIISSQNDDNHLEILYDILKWADLFVMPWVSTASLLAFCMDIPVVFIDIIKPRTFLKSTAKYKFVPCDGGEIITDPKRLVDTVEANLENPGRTRDKRAEQAQNFANIGAPGTALDRIYNVIKEEIDNSSKNTANRKVYMGLSIEAREALSKAITCIFKDKHERNYRTYLKDIRDDRDGKVVLEAVFGCPEKYLLARMPENLDLGHLPFSDENIVTHYIGKNASLIRFNDFESELREGSVDIIFDPNPWIDDSELTDRAKKYRGLLKPGGSVHFFLSNPGSLRNRLSRKYEAVPLHTAANRPIGIESTSKILSSLHFKLVDYDIVNPRKIHIEPRSPADKKWLRAWGTLYRAAKPFLPSAFGGLINMIFEKT